MNKTNEQPADEFDLKSLRVLEAIERDPHVTQRDLAHELGTALGVANACIHTLVKRGMIKIRGENKRSITYHLTKSGVLHKSRLAFEWTKNTIQYYRSIRVAIEGSMRSMANEGIKRIAIYGDTEIIEIALLVAPLSGVSIECIVSDDIKEASAVLTSSLGSKAGGLSESSEPHQMSIGMLSTCVVDALVICSDEGPELEKRLLSAAGIVLPVRRLL